MTETIPAIRQEIISAALFNLRKSEADENSWGWYLMSLLDQRKNSQISHAEIEKIFYDFYKDKLSVAHASFSKGGLFHAQGLPFDAWLEISKEDIQKDDYTYTSRMAGLCFLCGQEVPKHISDFWLRRIAPTHLQREKIATGKKKLEYQDRFMKTNHLNNWVW